MVVINKGNLLSNHIKNDDHVIINKLTNMNTNKLKNFLKSFPFYFSQQDENGDDVIDICFKKGYYDLCEKLIDIENEVKNELESNRNAA